MMSSTTKLKELTTTSNYMSLRVFFFSSRRRHTRFDCDWSSDVCSSDLGRRRDAMIKPAIGCLLLSACAFAQNGGSEIAAQEAKLVVLERLWNDAQLHRDARALEALIADRFVNTEYDGEVSERDKFLSDVKDPEFKPSLMN